MEREVVVNILKYYRDIDLNMKLNNKIISDFEDSYYAQSTTPSYSGQIHGGGDVSHPVEDMVLSVPEEIHVQMNQLKRENRKLLEEKVAITTALNSLAYVQKAILYSFYVKKDNWTKISREMNYCPSHCRNLRDKSLAELGTVLQGDKVILNILGQKNKSGT